MDNSVFSVEANFEERPRRRKNNARLAGALAALAEELCADDGPDGIRALERRPQTGGKPSPHVGRVCKATQRVVDAFLAAAPGATGLGHFIVASVRPIRGVAVLCVTIAPRADLPGGLEADFVLEPFPWLREAFCRNEGRGRTGNNHFRGLWSPCQSR